MELNYEDALLEADLLGFQLLGRLPPSSVEASGIPKLQKLERVVTFLHRRKAGKQALATKVTESLHAGDLLDIYEKDKLSGTMGPRVEDPEEILRSTTLSRGHAVRELRQTGWRTRAVDDMS